MASRIHQHVGTGPLEQVAAFDGPMLTGVTVSPDGRIFVCFPRSGEQVGYTVAELKDGQIVAYPSAAINRPASDRDPDALVSVQSVVVDPAGRLWILDTGSPEFKPTGYGGPKVVCVNLRQDRVVRTILFPTDVALPTSYLNDVRFDLRRGDGGMAFITDSTDKGPNGIVVVDLASGSSWRRLHDHRSTRAEPDFLPVIDGQPLLVREPGKPPSHLAKGSDGITMGSDGARLFFCPLASRRLHSVSLDALANRSMTDHQIGATVVDEGDKGGGADGLESDAEGRIYVTNYEHHAVLRRLPDGLYETVAHDQRIRWPDTLSLGMDGYLYITANDYQGQKRFHDGQDMRRKPYYLFRIQVGAHPVLLR